MAREDFRYKSEFRVRFGETDLQGVLFNGNYLLYVDTTQMDYLRRIGVTYSDMRAQGHDILIVDARVQFRSPARYDEVIEVYARIYEIGNSSIKMDFEMAEKESGRLVANAQTVYVIVEEEGGRPCRVPAYLRQAVCAFEENPEIEAE
ncbi:MAG: thioesterase family protein [bacterium]